jgi:hypothetical protein
VDERATAEAIAAYLFEIATRHIGLLDIADLAARSDRVGRTLLALRSAFETH